MVSLFVYKGHVPLPARGDTLLGLTHRIFLFYQIVYLTANCVVVLCNASVMVVVFAFPWLTAFVISDIAADRSDAGAEGAIETFEGGTGGVGEKVLENKEEVEMSLIEVAVQKDFAERWDLPVV